jgi:hypothetical protein
MHETNLISGSDFETLIIAKKYRETLTSICEEMKAELGKNEEKCVIVHPTDYTQMLLDIAENEVHLQKILTAITTDIDAKKMYAFGLLNTLQNKIEKIEKMKNEQVFSQLLNLFSETELVGKLQEFIRNIIYNGEVLGWLPMGIKDGYPFVPKHYVIVFVPFLEKFIARDIYGNDIFIHFLNQLGSQMKPRSTVSFMKDRYFAMQAMRKYKLLSFHYASRPLYVTRDSEKKNDKGTQDDKFNLLDIKLVNQNKVNEAIEKMFDDTTFTSTLGSKQKTVSKKNDMNNFIQQISSDVIDKNRINATLKQKIQDMELTMQSDDMLFTPFARHLQEGSDMAGSSLNVSRMCLSEEETIYEKDWISTAFGGVDSFFFGMGRSKHETNGKGVYDRKYDSSSNSFLEKKVVHYQNVIIYELLVDWMKEHNIPLSVIPRHSKSSHLSEIMDLKDFFSPTFFSLLLSHALDVPLQLLNSN